MMCGDACKENVRWIVAMFSRCHLSSCHVECGRDAIELIAVARRTATVAVEGSFQINDLSISLYS